MLKYSNTQILKYSSTHILKYWNTEILKHLNTQILKYQNTQILKYSDTQILKYSNTQILKYSNTQILKYSNTLTSFTQPLTRCSSLPPAWAQWRGGTLKAFQGVRSSSSWPSSRGHKNNNENYFHLWATVYPHGYSQCIVCKIDTDLSNEID